MERHTRQRARGPRPPHVRRTLSTQHPATPIPRYPQAAPFGRHVAFNPRSQGEAFLTDASHQPPPRTLQHRPHQANGGLGGSFKRLATLQSTGARCKIVRHLDVGPLVSQPDDPFPRRMFDIGVGVSFEMDTSRVNAVARVKLLDLCSVKLVPQPVLKLQKTWDLQLKGLALRAVYEVPMDSMDTPWAPPARIMLRYVTSVRRRRCNHVSMQVGQYWWAWLAFYGRGFGV